jgi:hypothetical protein
MPTNLAVVFSFIEGCILQVIPILLVIFPLGIDLSKVVLGEVCFV